MIGPKRCISFIKHQNVFTMIVSFPNHGKIIQNYSKSFQNIFNVMHEDRSGSDTYSPPLHLFQPHTEYYLTQEVDGCLGDGSEAAIS